MCNTIGSKICTACLPPLILNQNDSTCKECHGTCVTCTRSFCDSCRIGMYLDSSMNRCYNNCPINCANCDKGVCISCDNGYNLENAGNVWLDNVVTDVAVDIESEVSEFGGECICPDGTV